MPDEEFDSIDSIEKHYGKLRKAAEKDDDAEKVRQLGLEEREAKADFRERSAIARELDAHRKSALATAGIPEDFHEFVSGSTPEEIDASVKKVKERIEKLTKAQSSDDDQAQRLYGPAANGGGAPPGPRLTDDEKWIEDFQGRFDDPSATFSVAEVSKYAKILGGHKLLRGMAENSNIFKRNGITTEVVDQYEAGKLPQKRPLKTGVTVAPRA